MPDTPPETDGAVAAPLDDAVLNPPTPQKPDTADLSAETTLSATATAAEPGWVDPQQDWPYDWREFQGDRLAIRKPTQQALAALSLATNEFSTDERRTKYLYKFIDLHTSDGTWNRVFDRMMNPDDPDYTADSVTDFLKMVANVDIE